MTTTAEAKIEVGTADLRKALQAVLPHAEKNSSGDNGVEHRVRLSFGASEMLVMATNGLTTGVATVKIDADSRAERFAADDGAFVVDITPRQATMILRQFKVTRGPEAAGEMDEAIELHASDGHLKLSDVGGLFVGEAVEFPTLGIDSAYPDLQAMVGRALAGVGATQVGKPLVVDGRLLKLFAAASNVYDRPLDARASGDPDSPSWVIGCGPVFVGVVSSRHAEGDIKRTREAAHRAWLERLPAPKLATA